MWTSNVGFAIYNRPNAQEFSPIDLKDHRFANPQAHGANPGWALFIRHQVGSSGQVAVLEQQKGKQ
jgi:hypothetical protein